MNQVAVSVAQASESGAPLSLIWIDIDRFSQLNGSFGYEGGDAILAEFSHRLRSVAPANAVMGRVGDDEFLVLISDRELPDITHLASSLMKALETPLNMGDLRIRMTASAGIAMLEPGEGFAELLEKADWAKNAAKKQGGYRFVVSGDEPLPSHMGIIQAREDLEVEFLLHKAIDESGLQLHYQPVLDFRGNVLSVEALMRCNVNGKNIPPGRFFPVAEKSGLITRLCEWSLAQGTKQARQLSDAGMHTTVSINISRGQLCDSGFGQTLVSAINTSGVDPHAIELEFSESIFMDAPDIVLNNLRQAREMGVGLTIDNFGTGYSCLADLKDIPVGKVKLGGGLIRNLPDDARSYAIVKAMVSLCRDLDMTVIAEGVETSEQLESLKALSVDEIQGYYYARPMDVDTLKLWLAERGH